MSSSVFIGYVHIFLFLMVVEKIYTEDCGQSSYENPPDSSVEITEKGNAREGLWPWMVSITNKDSRGISFSPHCSGFLIDRRHIISTAHCFEKKDPEQYRARIGSINQNEGDEYRISRIVIHSGYTKHFYYNDIALLTLEREVSSTNFNPICLPDEEVSKIDLTNRRTAVAGWGQYGPRSSYDPYLKFRTGLKVMTNEQCENGIKQILSTFRRQFPYGMTRDIICTTSDEESTDVCVTSGGPLMIKNGNRWFAVGISSFGVVCGHPGVPDGYTNVINYLSWIRQNTDCGVSRYENSPEEAMYPWMAAIRKKEGRSDSYPSVCSGFLIDSKHLLSAAHCYEADRDVELYRARIGHINQDKGEEYRIIGIAVHPDYMKGVYYNDIAILTLDREVNSSHFNPICLPDEEVSKMDLIGKNSIEIGWGLDAPGESKHGAYLKYQTGLVIMSNEQCWKKLLDVQKNIQRTFPRDINEDIICAAFGESSPRICISSGSPLMIHHRNRWFAVGVASFGVSCGRPGTPFGYANVTHYMDWIRQSTC